MSPFRPCSAVALLALCAAGLASLPAQAQWKWRDANNRVQYSDLPPPAAVPDSAILQRPQGGVRSAGPTFVAPPPAAASAAVPASGPLQKTDPELEARRKQAEQQEAAKQKAEQDRIKAGKAESCERAKAQLRLMESGMRVAQVNAAGEREIMDDEARAREAKRASGVMAADCK